VLSSLERDKCTAHAGACPQTWSLWESGAPSLWAPSAASSLIASVKNLEPAAVLLPLHSSAHAALCLLTQLNCHACAHTQTGTQHNAHAPLTPCHVRIHSHTLPCTHSPVKAGRACALATHTPASRPLAHAASWPPCACGVLGGRARTASGAAPPPTATPAAQAGQGQG